MSLNKKQSGFIEFYNGYTGKRIFGAMYSLAAAMVILGALFKIMHWPMAGLVLSVGMLAEVFVFAMGVFDKPFKTYDWDRVFSFDGSTHFSGSISGGQSVMPAVAAQVAAQVAAPAVVQAAVPATSAVTMQAPERLLDGEMVALSEGIRNLSATAKQLATLSSAIGSAVEFSKNIESATEAAARFTSTQGSLNSVVEKLHASYSTLNTDMSSVMNGTEQYAGKIGDINKNLSSLNSVYEIQLKNIQNQSEAISTQSQMILSQTEHTRLVGASLSEIIAENEKIKQSTKTVAEETNRYKEASALLASQVSDLNKVYGNMLNALN